MVINHISGVINPLSHPGGLYDVDATINVVRFGNISTFGALHVFQVSFNGTRTDHWVVSSPVHIYLNAADALQISVTPIANNLQMTVSISGYLVDLTQ